MKKWLNNPYVVASLALLACYVVYMQIAPLLNTDTEFSSYDDSSTPEDAFINPDSIHADVHTPTATTQGVSNFAQQEATDLSSLRALGVAKRDPFAPWVELSVNNNKKKRTKIARRKQIEKLPNLTAVIAGPKGRYAVFDAEIVEVGSTVGNFTVEAIFGRSVSLIGPEGSRTVSLVTDLQGEYNE